VLKASGVSTEGKREVLGVSVSLSEAEPHWRTFLTRLVDRGLRGVELITSDARAGLAYVHRTVSAGVPWQRCQFHRQQNVQAYVPRQDMKIEVAADIRAIFYAPSRHEAERLLVITVQKYQAIASSLSEWPEESIPQGLTVFTYPASHRRLLRTVDGLERLAREMPPLLSRHRYLP